eukprot:CAMPEP_0182454114 /NCGR_PEP_ID=MMETSP1319-20130603/885_1 /TAXON_ID=172717 /ORGANISM="Bolidomonas pacifica, Strain RCC208" /LENGTH=354 /DNA_ID=CAMNT_0024652093 /DNA_START=112 /DNA_END=1172 /DNA_ORIENTATION=+
METYRIYLFIGLVTFLSLSSAKEFVATDEWQVLPPEDSVPAGLHIRLDMETGQRWAKIAKADDGDAVTTREEVEAMRRGENIAGGGNTNPTGKMGNALIVGEEKAEGGEGKFDYELMYRTYMRIPEDERPALPDKSTLPAAEWESQMKAIWVGRQELIQKAIESIEEVPDVLSSIIATISSPSDSLASELTELEYLLSDIDVARDFYILRGWPPLLQLLKHPDPETVSAALHCVGTALKNTGEFNDWEGLADVAPLLGSHPDLGKVLYALGGMLRASPSRLSSFLAEMDGEASLLAAARAARGLKAARKSCDLAADLGLPDPEWCQVCAKVLLQSGAPVEHQAAMEGMLRLECG